jgi:hypothetical protein
MILLSDAISAGYPQMRRDLLAARGPDDIAALVLQRLGHLAGSAAAAARAALEAEWAWLHHGRRLLWLEPRVVNALLEVPMAPVVAPPWPCAVQWAPHDALIHGETGLHYIGGWLLPATPAGRVPLLSAWAGHGGDEEVLLPSDWTHLGIGTPTDWLLRNLCAALSDPRLSTRLRLRRGDRLARKASRSTARPRVERLELTPDYRGVWREVVVGPAEHHEAGTRTQVREHAVSDHTARAWVRAMRNEDDEWVPVEAGYDCDLEAGQVVTRCGRRSILIAVRVSRRGHVRGRGLMPARLTRVIGPSPLEEDRPLDGDAP